MAIPASRVFLVSALIMSLSSFAAASDSLRFDIEPVFEGRRPMTGVTPMAVDIQNLGADARGVVRVTSQYGQVDYPIELPRGANKRLITYPTSWYGETQFSLLTNQGNVLHSYPTIADEPDGQHVLLISDVPGEMAFIASTPSASASTSNSNGSTRAVTALLDCYGRAGSCPTRPVGYSGVSIIVLGTGSERLSNAEVQAIRLWVDTGGMLVFLGGASSPILSDKRWSDMLPVRDFRVAQLDHSAILSGLASMQAEEANFSKNVVAPDTSVMAGTPVIGATARMEGSIPVWADMPHGLGKVTFLSFNPFEAPLNKWTGRHNVMTRILRTTGELEAGMYLQKYTVGAGGPIGGSGGYMPAMGGSTVDSIENDPFSMKLPPTGSIFMVLAGYFLCVVPLNFLVLKKLKRGELAWFTAPVISLAFAGLLFKSAGSLYGAKMSTVSNGIIVAQEGDPEAMFIGNTQMFIPHAGSYDLKLKGVDVLGSVQGDNTGRMYDDGPNQQSNNLAPVDIGEMEVPDLDANNLSFRRLIYRQRVPISTWLHVRLEPTGVKSAKCILTNTSPYALGSANLVVGRKEQSIPDLLPGQQQTIDVTFETDVDQNDLTNDDVRMFTLKKKRVALTGQLRDFRPGPQLGQDVPAHSQVNVALFSAWTGRQP